MHIRRIKTEEKAKVVASVRGEEFIKFLAALVVLHFDNYDDTNMMNSSFSFKSFGCNSLFKIVLAWQNNCRGKELNKFFHQNRSDDSLPFLLSLSFF